MMLMVMLKAMLLTMLKMMLIRSCGGFPLSACQRVCSITPEEYDVDRVDDGDDDGGDVVDGDYLYTCSHHPV